MPLKDVCSKSEASAYNVLTNLIAKIVNIDLRDISVTPCFLHITFIGSKAHPDPPHSTFLPRKLISAALFLISFPPDHIAHVRPATQSKITEEPLANCPSQQRKKKELLRNPLATSHSDINFRFRFAQYGPVFITTIIPRLRTASQRSCIGNDDSLLRCLRPGPRFGRSVRSACCFGICQANNWHIHFIL